MAIKAVNWPKKVKKYKDNNLQADEQIVATLVLQVKGAVTRGAVVGGLGGAAGAATQNTALTTAGAVAAVSRDQSGRGQKRSYNVEGMASKLPVAPLLLVLTNKGRILVYSFVLARLTLTYEAAYKQKDLASIEVRPGFFARKATLRFADGSALNFDLPRFHEFKPFVALING